MSERHHFLIDPQRVIRDKFFLNGSEGHHLWNVVRLGEMDEISSMKEHKIPSVSLGQARLRSETAAIAASAVILEFHHARKSDV